jgi:two-component system response regulator AtoC
MPEPSGLVQRQRFAHLFAYGSKMRAIRFEVEQVADTDVPVLVRGETGVGKDLVARALHQASSRRNGPLVRVSCAAIPGDLLESELFGHERGAFTGADRRRPGKFELAENGTLLLDEIGDLPLALQAKLLHVLQDGEFTRVGGNQPLKATARVVATSSRNLLTAARRGDFREDLYYRLAVVVIEVPPLRERRAEIPVLAHMFLRRFNAAAGRDVWLTSELMALLTAYDWPGNVRQLEHMMKRAVILNDPGVVRNEIEHGANGGRATPPWAPPAGEEAPAPPSLKELARRAARDAEREAIRGALARTRGNRVEAARQLRVSYKALLYKMAQCGLSGKVLP